jgi:hypothetical protein
MFSAMSDDTLYRWPSDIGSGKMWKYFFVGAGLTLATLLVKSPLRRAKDYPPDETDDGASDHDRKGES